MRNFYLLSKVTVLLAAALLVQPVLPAEDLNPSKGHFNISNSTINEGHTGVVVFATKPGFVVVWSDDYNIKMQFFKKSGKKVGSPKIIHQNTVHKIHRLEGVWAGKWGAIVWTQDTGLGVSIWGKILNKKGAVRAAPPLPLTHGFGSSTRKFGSPTVSWNGKNLLIAFMETEPGTDIYCGKFTSNLARLGTFKKVKSGKDGTPHSLGALPHKKGWILSWTEEKAAGGPSSLQSNGGTATPWFSIRKQSNAGGKSLRGWMTLPTLYSYVLFCRAWQRLNGQIAWLVIAADNSSRLSVPWAVFYIAAIALGQYNGAYGTPITWLNLMDVRVSRLLLAYAGYAYWLHFWRASLNVNPNLWILFYVDGNPWLPYDFGRCLGYIVYFAAFANYYPRSRSLCAYSAGSNDRQVVTQVYGRFLNHPAYRRQ